MLTMMRLHPPFPLAHDDPRGVLLLSLHPAGTLQSHAEGGERRVTQWVWHLLLNGTNVQACMKEKFFPCWILKIFYHIQL